MFARRSVCDLMSSRTHMEQEEQLSDVRRALTIDLIGFDHISELIDYARGSTLAGCVANQRGERCSRSSLSLRSKTRRRERLSW